MAFECSPAFKCLPLGEPCSNTCNIFQRKDRSAEANPSNCWMCRCACEYYNLMKRVRSSLHWTHV